MGQELKDLRFIRFAIFDFFFKRRFLLSSAISIFNPRLRFFLNFVFCHPGPCKKELALVTHLVWMDSVNGEEKEMLPLFWLCCGLF